MDFMTRKVFLIADQLREKEKESSTKQHTKQRICRKGHGLLDGFRDLSIVGVNNYAIARSSLRRPSRNGSLGDSDSSDCDSQGDDDSCLWEIYNSEDKPLYVRSPIKCSSSNKTSTKVLQKTSTVPSPEKSISFRKNILSPATTSKSSPIIPSPMLIASPFKSKSPVKCRLKDTKSKSSPAITEKFSLKSISTKSKSPVKGTIKVKVESPKENLSKTNLNAKTSPQKSGEASPKIPQLPSKTTKPKSINKPISFYFSKKTKSKLISSPRLIIPMLKSPLSMSTPKSSSRKHVKPSKSISQKDSSFLGVSFQLTPSLKKNGSSICSNVLNSGTKMLKEGRLKRHTSMLESPSTPMTDKYGRFISSEPRPKRKIDLSSNNDDIFENEIKNKKARRGINLEDQPSNFKTLFFTPLPNYSDQELGVTPIKILKECKSCGTNHTPLWRDADNQTPLCNACGIRWKKYRIRCTRCWYIPMKEEKAVPYCPGCGNYGSIKRCNTLRRFTSCIY